MNELMITLVHGGKWTERERKIGRWIRRILVASLTIIALVWNHHWQKLGAENQVWREWVNTQCMQGDRETCMSYVDFALPSGMPADKFWVAHPQLSEQAKCIERMGWISFSVGRKDYRELMEFCKQ